MNSTVLDHHATASQLYAASGTDFSKLNWLESNWAAWYMWIGNPIIATGLMSFIMHEVRNFFSVRGGSWWLISLGYRSCTLDDASLGLSSTRSRTLENGSSNL